MIHGATLVTGSGMGLACGVLRRALPGFGRDRSSGLFSRPEVAAAPCTARMGRVTPLVCVA